MEKNSQRLLILGCSRAKRHDAGLLPAVDRYDGTAFRVLRKYLRERPPHPPVLLILSAEFGLIGSTEPIPDYDRRMSAERACELRPLVQEVLGTECVRSSFDEVFICVGVTYRATLDKDVQWGAAQVFWAAPRGRGLSALRDWLREAAARQPTVLSGRS